jgi:hypothetical protein
MQLLQGQEVWQVHKSHSFIKGSKRLEIEENTRHKVDPPHGHEGSIALIVPRSATAMAQSQISDETLRELVHIGVKQASNIRPAADERCLDRATRLKTPPNDGPVPVHPHHHW